MAGRNIEEHPVHLGLGATAIPQPGFIGDPAWYMEYAERHKDDGAEGRLVAMHTFSEPWTSWEMHPHGSELVLCIAGHITLIQESDDGRATAIGLGPGEFAINEPAVWHTADVDEEATVLFVTAGMGTQHRPR